MGRDTELQSTVDLLSQANISEKLDISDSSDLASGPLTGPADVDVGNIFEKAFTDQKRPVEGPREATERHGSIPE